MSPVDLQQGAAISLNRSNFKRCDVESKAYNYVKFPGTNQMGYHNSCACNEYQSLVKRHLINRRTNFDALYFKKVFRDAWANAPETFKISSLSFCNSYVGGKRAVYLRAREMVRSTGFMKHYANISMFVKPDRYFIDDVWTKAPRAIQYRTPMYNILVGCYLKPFEHAVYAIEVNGLRVVAKGLNNVERAENIIAGSAMFRNPLYIMLDHSKFDSHIKTEMLVELHKLYVKRAGDNWLRFLLRHSLVNKGYSKNGLRYTVKGTRMSGDYDTGLGNTMINIAVLLAYVGNTKHHMLVDGDDSIIIVEAADYPGLDPGVFDQLGFATEIGTTTDLHEVEFCQSKLLPTEPPRFARDYRKAFSKIQLAFKRYDDKSIHRYLAGIGQGELSVSNGVPMLAPMAAKLAALSKKPIFEANYYHRYGRRGIELPITTEVRAAYCTAWGYSIAEQLMIERSDFQVQFTNKYFYYTHDE